MRGIDMKKAFILIPVILAALMACHIASVEPPITAPIILVSPADGSTLHDPVIVAAIAGSGYSFTHVNFFIDSVLVASDSVAPYQFYWNIFDYRSNIAHSIVAIGYTSDTTYVKSASISVSVVYSAGFSIAADYRPNSQHAVGVRAYQNILFVANLDLGLEALDISSITSPVFSSRFSTQGQLTHAVALYPYIYIAAGSQGVIKADFSNIDSLVEIARFMDQNFVNDIKSIGNNLLVLENGYAIVLSPDSLIELSRLVISDIFQYAATQGNYAFLAGDNALYIIDCTNPHNVNQVGSYNNSSRSLGVAVIDTFAFVAYGDQGVTALSVANPSNPRALSRFNPGQQILRLAAGDNTLFAASGDGQVYAIDYTVPDTLRQIDHLNIGNLLIGEIDYQSPYLFVAADAAVEILRFVR
jgi:hypothetical protein